MAAVNHVKWATCDANRRNWWMVYTTHMVVRTTEYSPSRIPDITGIPTQVVPCDENGTRAEQMGTFVRPIYSDTSIKLLIPLLCDQK